MRNVLVTGAGGFIGHHLVSRLKDEGHYVRAVDIKEPEYAPTRADEFLVSDLRERENAEAAAAGAEDVYALAADMGGMGFISANNAPILRNNTLIDVNTIHAAAEAGVVRYLYTSSACVYPESLQMSENVEALREDDAYPAQPQDAYGWEKLTGEELCRHYYADYGLDVRIVRFHNIYGPLGTWTGGREKAPAAMCRKVALASPGAEIEVWGDGEQTRSFCYIDDCIDGIRRIMESGMTQPLNLGRSELVSINQLAALVIRISGKAPITIRHIDGPMGVRGRNSNNDLCRALLDWEPGTDLETGLRHTYSWVEQQVLASFPA